MGSGSLWESSGSLCQQAAYAGENDKNDGDAGDDGDDHDTEDHADEMMLKMER